MIILFEESATEFTNLGLGVLKDAISCNVKEKLNDEFDLEMEYPVSGSNYSKIKNERIIFANPNPYDNAQPFRIYSITKPLKGTVMVYAHHISYDMNGIPCKPVVKYDEDGKATSNPVSGLNEALNAIQNGAYIKYRFSLLTNISSNKTFKTSQPYNMRALLMGSEDNSLVGVYKGEIKFDKFEAYIYDKRGKNRGAQVCYGYNMTDLKHESTTDKLYNGVFPYYHKETTSTETTTEDSFKKAYIVGTKPFQDGWLSFTEGGDPYHPLDNTPVQIATEGDYMDKVYAWDENYQKYVEKIYNESVTLIQGVLEPSWIVIDWKSFPNIICRANAKGYFKSPTDTEWGAIKGVGDAIFEGNILKEGLNGLVSNMIIYFAEVIPSGSEASNTEITDVVEVILDDPIIKVNTSDANAMTYDKVLSLDLTSEFEEEPTKDQLRTKAEEWISKNQIGTIKHTTTVSFIDLQNTSEAGRYKNFEHIELGDTVRVIYRDLGVDVELRVISYDYNVLAGRYEDIELGEKEDSLSTATIQNGDSISSLTNDVGYADITTVNKLIASTITAEYLQAVNAKLSKAQIEQLAVEKIECKGIIEASQFVLDELVAKLLIADNAKITETLEAGLIKVAGNIEVKQGSILIGSEDGTVFKVDEQGNLEANSVNITGGSLNINDNFEVTNDGVMTAKAGKIGDCEIDEEGHLKVPSANIEGLIEAAKVLVKDINNETIFEADSESRVVKMGSFTADKDGLKSGDITSFDDDRHEEGVYIGKDGIRLGKKFSVNKEGNLEANSVNISGSIEASDGKIAGFNINEGSIKYGTEDESDSIVISSLGLQGHKSTNQGINDSYSVVKLIFNKLRKISVYIRSSAESNYDYMMASIKNASSYPTSFNSVNTFAHTKGNQHSEEELQYYTKVDYTDLEEGDYIYLVFRKDTSTHQYDDTGYFLIPNVGSDHLTITNPGATETNVYRFDRDTTLDINRTFMKLGENYVVDGDGNVTAKSIDITGGSLSSCYVDGDFEIQNGNLVARQKVVIGDQEGGSTGITLLKGSSSVPETLTVTNFQAHVQQDPSGQYHYISYSITISSDSSTGKPTIDSIWTVSVKYRVNNRDRINLTSILIPAGTTTKTANSSYIPLQAIFMAPVVPDQSTQVLPIAGYPGLMLNSNYYPTVNAQYNLGSASLKWNDIYAANSTIQTSDRKDKTDINYNIDLYEKVFDGLKPASFKFIKGSSNRKHLGFIAQDIEQTLIDNSIDTKDFACLVKSKNSVDDEYVYGLRYGELHAMEVHKIKKLEKEIEELKSIILELTNKNQNG